MSSEHRIESLLHAWMAALQEGAPVAPDELCRDCPELLGSLKSKIAEIAESDEQLHETIPQHHLREASLPNEPEDYVIEGVLGTGSMGAVYKARQRGTDRLVALKMARQDWMDRLSEDGRRQAIDQFYVEIRAAARLRHPNIVQVLHMGESDGHPFFAMELVEGESLADKIKRCGPLGNRSAAAHIASVATGVHEAHRHGVLHRDIKVQNIIHDQEHDVTKVADFGLAELRADSEPLAGDRSASPEPIVGTVLYMAPELLCGASGGTVSSDVYSLGATLYELLTGRPPFPAATIDQVKERILTEEPIAPSRCNKNVAKELDAICLKCLAKDPVARFDSAAQLAEALLDYLEAPRFAAHMATMSRWVMGFAGAVLLINLIVLWMLQGPFVEPLAWLLVFGMYPPLFLLVANIPQKSERDNQLARSELWSLWLGKAVAAALMSIEIRWIVAPDARLAIQMAYPMFAALSGMVCFALGASFWRGFYLCAIGFWVLGALMLLNLPLAPLGYALYSAAVIAAYGIYLNRLSKELP